MHQRIRRREAEDLVSQIAGFSALVLGQTLTTGCMWNLAQVWERAELTPSGDKRSGPRYASVQLLREPCSGSRHLAAAAPTQLKSLLLPFGLARTNFLSDATSQARSASHFAGRTDVVVTKLSHFKAKLLVGDCHHEIAHWNLQLRVDML